MEGMTMIRYASSLSAVIFAAVAALPVTAQAIPAITCHCFTDRSYDPARPAAADPYLLATTANSFLAVALKMEKRTIVIKKQKGTSNDDLWIAAWGAARGGGSVDDLLEAKQKAETWQKALAAAGVAPKALGPRVSASLTSGGAAPAVAQAVVDELLVQHKLLAEPELAAMRKSWGTNQEMIITALLAAKTKQPASQILAEVKKGGKTWGALLQQARIEPKELQNEFAALLKPRER